MNPYAALLQLYTYHSEVAKQAIPVRLGCHGSRPREADCKIDSDVSFNDLDKHTCSLLQISVLALGGIGVSLGFAFWGWKIVRCIGGGITYLSPSRGFSAQLCALATVLLATKVELPVSALHILLGSIIGVGLADSMQNLNWMLLLVFLAAWVATLIVTSATAAGFFAFTIYSPSYVA
jgi:phosphate/sulfate permease